MDSRKDQMENINLNNNVVTEDNDMIDADSYSEYDESTDNESVDLNEVLSEIIDADLLPSNHKASYEILSLAQIQNRQETDIINVSNALSITRTEAIACLLYINWDVESVIDKWALNQMEFRQEVGLCQTINPKTQSSETDTGCKKCSGIVPDYLASVAFCGHKFCRVCWQDFVGVALTETRLLISCPEESCGGAISQELIALVGSPSEQSVYANIFVRSYLTDFKKGKWCPSPGCEHGVLLDCGSFISRFTCKCLSSFCYRCDKEDHHPVSCDDSENWRIESCNQAHNRKLISVRDCPKCSWTFEVSSSDLRIECQSCKFEFCGTCNGSYLEHGDWQGGKFKHICPEEMLQMVSEIEKYRENARNAVNRYNDYLAHWGTLHQDQHRVLIRLRMMMNNEMNILAEKQGLPLDEVSFVKDAWLQAAECKRVFKWASVYDYYYIHGFQENKKHFYNSMLEQGAFVLDELCKAAADLSHFISDASPPTLSFEEFRERLSFKSRVARNFFESIEIAIYNGYQDMESLRNAIRSGQQSIEPSPEESTAKTIDWTCKHCRFTNYGSTTLCFMCYH